jgi:catechol 2,3-dioxygenase-like lactoylglutathione lyase family enzyme
MPRALAAVTLVVRDYDEAIAFFTGALNFELVQDEPREGGKRWVLVRPRDGGVALLLARAVTPEQRDAIGRQTGGRVAFFLHTDDFQRDHAHMLAHGVRFTEEPREESYGTVAVFLDLHGNRWDLVQPKG